MTTTRNSCRYFRPNVAWPVSGWAVFLALLVANLVVSLGSSGRACAEDPAKGSDWPRFQGPLGNGSSPETGLLRTWPSKGPRVLWRTPTKPGWGAPSIAGNDVILGWTNEYRGDSETIACLNANDGQIRWTHKYDVGPYWERNIGWARGGFRSSACIEGDWVVTLGAVGHLHCISRKTGNVLWAKNLWDEWNPSGEKGYVFSPIVVEGKLILWYGDGVSRSNEPYPDPENELGKFSVLCRALNLETGEVLWEYLEPHNAACRRGEGQTPAVATFGGDTCIVVTANAELKALRVKDGTQIWSFSCPQPRTRGTTIPTPLILADSIINIPDADPTHSVLVDFVRPAERTLSRWTIDLGLSCPIHQFRQRDGYLYGFVGQIHGVDEQAASDSTCNLVCLDATSGAVQWQQQGFMTGVSIIEADGLLFTRSYQTLRLIEANPQKYVRLGEVHTHDMRKPTLNLVDFVQPCLSRGRLFVRTAEELICYEVAQHPESPVDNQAAVPLNTNR